jgi:hypothetical protein
MVICIAVYTSAQIGKTVLLKRMVSVFFIFPKDVKKRKSWVNAVNRTDWSLHRHMKYSVILLCSAHLLMDGTVSVMTQSFHTTKNTELIGLAGD